MIVNIADQLSYDLPGVLAGVGGDSGTDVPRQPGGDRVVISGKARIVGVHLGELDILGVGGRP